MGERLVLLMLVISTMVVLSKGQGPLSGRSSPGDISNAYTLKEEMEKKINSGQVLTEAEKSSYEKAKQLTAGAKVFTEAEKEENKKKEYAEKFAPFFSGGPSPSDIFSAYKTKEEMEKKINSGQTLTDSENSGYEKAKQLIQGGKALSSEKPEAQKYETTKATAASGVNAQNKGDL